MKAIHELQRASGWLRHERRALGQTVSRCAWRGEHARKLRRAVMPPPFPFATALHSRVRDAYEARSSTRATSQRRIRQPRASRATADDSCCRSSAASSPTTTFCCARSTAQYRSARTHPPQLRGTLPLNAAPNTNHTLLWQAMERPRAPRGERSPRLPAPRPLPAGWLASGARSNPCTTSCHHG
jgi:hypothetical protein